MSVCVCVQFLRVAGRPLISDPFKTLGSKADVIRQGITRVRHLSPELADVLTSCCADKAADRPDSRAALALLEVRHLVLKLCVACCDSGVGVVVGDTLSVVVVVCGAGVPSACCSCVTAAPIPHANHEGQGTSPRSAAVVCGTACVCCPGGIVHTHKAVGKAHGEAGQRVRTCGALRL